MYLGSAQVHLQMYLGTITKYQIQVYNITDTSQWPNVGLLLGKHGQRLGVYWVHYREA